MPGNVPVRTAASDDRVDAILWNAASATTAEACDAGWAASLLEQYKLYVEMSDRVAQRRVAASTYFLSVNSAILAFVGYLTAKDSAQGLWILALAGLVLCALWRRIIFSYRDLNTAKLLIVHRIEKRLPISPYDAEWEAMGRGVDPKRYRPLSHVESGVPVVFFILHLIVLARAVPWSALR